jgi:hypothetical protein
MMGIEVILHAERYQRTAAYIEILKVDQRARQLFV